MRADFPADPASAGQARRFVGATLQEWQCDGLLDAATLLVSELVSNAILHARTTIRVVIQASGQRVRVEVHDGDKRAPTRKQYSSLATTGRGLLLLERMSDEWGVTTDGEGKRIWFELDRTGGASDPLERLDFSVDLDDLADPLMGGERDSTGEEPPASRSDGPRLLAGVGVECR